MGIDNFAIKIFSNPSKYDFPDCADDIGVFSQI